MSSYCGSFIFWIEQFIMKYVLFCFCRVNRYVLFLTENYAALDILMNPKNYLGEGLSFVPVKREPASRQTSLVEEAEAEATDAEAAQEPESTKSAADVQPFILFGSSFPKDKEYTQVFFRRHVSTYIRI